jgi:hypothetical protein
MHRNIMHRNIMHRNIMYMNSPAPGISVTLCEGLVAAGSVILGLSFAGWSASVRDCAISAY